MVQIFDEWRLHDEIDESRTDELDESRAEATTTLRPPGAEDTTTRTVGHSMTKTMPARSAPVVRLVGPLHDTSGGAVCAKSAALSDETVQEGAHSARHLHARAR